MNNPFDVIVTISCPGRILNDFTLPCNAASDHLDLLAGPVTISEFDKRAVALTHVDFFHAVFLDCLSPDDVCITARTHLQRLKENYPDYIRLGSQHLHALWKNYQHSRVNSVLELLHQTKGVTNLTFFGTILLFPGGVEAVLSLQRLSTCRWVWNHNSLYTARIKFQAAVINT